MRKLLLFIFLFFTSGFVLPEQNIMPVLGATPKDWNPKSFWYYPWGKNRVHKGVDIFAPKNTPVLTPTQGFVLFNGNSAMGGNVVLLIGAKWRIHYFAHLNTIETQSLKWIGAGQRIGTVGSSGNAQGKSPHLHYSIKSLFPLLWQYDPRIIKSWSRLFYIDPIEYLMGMSYE